MPSQGRYYRNIFNERKRYAGALAQRGETGRPAYLVDSDFRDWSDIMMRGLQRLAQTMHPTGAFIGDSFKLTEVPAALGLVYQDNNFYLLGRRDVAGTDNPTGEYAGAGYLGGLRVSLFQSTDFECVADSAGTFDTDRADGIHRKFTAAGQLGPDGYIEDHRARYRTNALVGLDVRVYDGPGPPTVYNVASNTANRIVLTGYAASAVQQQSGDRYYFVKLRTPAADETLDVYLDVHLEDWGANEDLALNHNPGGSTLEGMRRWKIVQQVFINYPDPVTGEPSQPITDYIDHGGTQHYVVKLAAIDRVNGVAPVVDADIDDAADREAGVGSEVREARDFLNLCVADADQPVNLSERLAREHSWTTVGVAGNEGVHNDPAGLEDALACADIHTIYLKAGVYNFPAALTISAGKHIYAEPGVSIVAQDVVTIEANVQLHNVYFSLSGGGAFVLVTGANVLFDGVSIVDLITNSAVHALNLSTDAFQFHAVNSRIYTRTRPGVSVVTQAGSSPSSVRQAGASVNIPPAALFVRSVISADQIGGTDAAVLVDSGMQTVFDDCSLVSSARIIDAKLTGQSANYTAAASTLDNVTVENCHLVRIGRDAGSSATAVRFSRSFFSFRGNTLVFEAESGAVAPVYPAISVEVEDVGAYSGRGTVEGNVLLVKGVGVYYESTVTFSKLAVRDNVFTALDTSATQAILLAAGGTQNNIDVDGNLISFQNAVLAEGISITDEGRVTLRNNVVYGAKYGVRINGFTGKVILDKCKFFLCTTGFRQEAGTADQRAKIQGCSFDQGVTGIDCNTGKALAIGCDFNTFSSIGASGSVQVIGGRFEACALGYSGDQDVSDSAFMDCTTGLTNTGTSVKISNCQFTDYATAGIIDNGSAQIYDCNFDAPYPSPAISPGVETRVHRCRFTGSSGNVNTFSGYYVECEFHATQAAAEPIITIGARSLTLIDCVFDCNSRAVPLVYGNFAGSKFAHIEGCTIKNSVHRTFDIENPLSVYIVDNNCESLTDEAKGAFSPENRPFYIHGTAVTDRFIISRNTFTGCGIAVEMPSQSEAGSEICDNTFDRVSGGLFLRARNFLVARNRFSLLQDSTSRSDEPRTASAIWVGPNTASLDLSDAAVEALWVAAATECADCRVIDNTFSDSPGAYTADVIANNDSPASVARPAAIMVAGNSPVVKGNTFSAQVSGGCSIMLGNIAEAKLAAAGNRRAVDGGIVEGNTVVNGFIVLVMKGGNTYLVQNNAFAFAAGAAAPTLVMGFKDTGSAGAPTDVAGSLAVLRFVGNEAFHGTSGTYDVERAHTADYWGVLRVSSPKNYDVDAAAAGIVAVEPARWRASSVATDHRRPQMLVNVVGGAETLDGNIDLWKLLNNFNLGADLEV